MQCRILFHDRQLQGFDWCKLGADREQAPECGSAHIDELSAICAQVPQVVVFIPQQAVLLATPQLPPRASKQQLGAIAFTLEESLAQDIEDCFFAVLPQQSDNTVPVAVIERELMDEVSQLLNRCHINARWILPAVCLCPWHNDEEDLLATLCVQDNGVLIRHGKHQGLYCDAGIAVTVLKQLAKSSDSARKRVELYGGDDELLSNLGRGASWVVNAHDALPLLAQPVETASCINLKQKDYLSTRQWSGLFDRWRWPLMVLLMSGLVFVAGNAWDHWQKRQQLDDLILQQQQLLATYLPDLPQSDYPKKQLIDILAQNRSGDGKAGFIDLLYEFSRLKAQFGQINIDKMVYQKGQLAVNLQGRDLNAMESFRARLETSRYPGKIENVSINPDKTTARLVMQGVQ